MATNLGDEEEELLGYRPPAMTVNLDDSDDDDDDDGDSDGMSSDDDNPTPGERLTNRPRLRSPVCRAHQHSGTRPTVTPSTPPPPPPPSPLAARPPTHTPAIPPPAASEKEAEDVGGDRPPHRAHPRPGAAGHAQRAAAQEEGGRANPACFGAV